MITGRGSVLTIAGRGSIGTLTRPTASGSLYRPAVPVTGQGTVARILALSPVLWLRSGVEMGPGTEDNSLLDAWDDQSGHGNDFSQLDSEQTPTLRLGSNGIAGRAAASFPTGTNLRGGDLAAFDVGTGPFALLLLVKGGADEGVILSKDTWNGDGNGLLIYRQTPAFRYWPGSGSSGQFGTANSSAHVLGVRRTGTGADGVELWYDGTLAVTLTDSRTLSNALAVTLGDAVGGGHSFEGLVSDVLGFNTLISLTDFEWMMLQFRYWAGQV
jgi:hypothetical protein